MANYPSLYWILGGDRRQAAMAEMLTEGGYPVACLGNPYLQDTCAKLPERFPPDCCVILPIRAFTPEGTLSGDVPLREEDILSRLRPDTYVFGGMLPERLQMRRGADLMRLEQVAVANAVPTAEGAIQLLLQELPVTLHGANCLVLGFGRIGKALALRLQALHAQVTVAARSARSFAEIEAHGLRSEHIRQYRHGLRQYQCVLNTVPAPVFDEQDYAELAKDCLLVELASAPDGIDAASCRSNHLHYCSAHGLPGKTAPKTAGHILLTAIFQNMEA